MTFITVVIWTVMDVYHTRITSQAPTNLQAELEPLDPKLNTELVTNLRTRYNLDNLPQPVISIPTPISTNSANTATSSSAAAR